MEDKIRKIMDESTDYQTGEVDAEIAISKLLDLFSVNKCNCPNESTDLYDENGNLVAWGCLHCGFIDRQ